MSDPLPNSDYYVDMGLPSGALWANRNLDVNQHDRFAQSPYQYSCSFFSWGNVEGHNPTSNSSFSPYSWGSINNASPYYEGQVYGSTPGSSLTENIPQNKSFDAARANVGAPWRLPSSAEFRELLENCDYIDEAGNIVEGTNKIVTVNSVQGIYLRSKINGQKLFFAACGDGRGHSWQNRSSVGLYMSNRLQGERTARILGFDENGVVYNDARERYLGIPVRPVCSLRTFQLTRLNVSRQELAVNVELLDLDDKITPIELPVIKAIDSISQTEDES